MDIMVSIRVSVVVGKYADENNACLTKREAKVNELSAT